MSLLLTGPAFPGLLAAAALVLAFVAWRRGLRWKPAWLVRFGLLAGVLLGILAGQARPDPAQFPGRQVLVLDDSDSISPAVRGSQRAQAREWLTSGENRLVVVFGQGMDVVVGSEWPDINGQASTMAAALDQAADLLGGEPGRVILATDGNPSDPLEFQRAFARLVDNGHQAEILPADSSFLPNDLYVGDPYLPSAMWENSPFTMVLPVYSPADSRSTLTLTRNGEPVLEEDVLLTTGENLVPVRLQTFQEEILTFSAALEFEGDPQPENNVVFASLRVFPAPRVLVLTEEPGVLVEFVQVLRSAGLRVTTLNPNLFVPSLNELEPYQAVILHNFLAGSLNDSQVRTLKDYVFQLGRGLLFLGGRNAYTLGGYKNTLLEPMLPVRLEPPPRDQNTPLTFVLAFDRSASMAPQRTPNNLRPITLAREAAIRAVENLGPEDYLGVLTYNTSAAWTIPIGPVGEGLGLQRTKDAISQVNASGGTSIFNALNTSVLGVLDADTSETRHILLLSDGQSSDGTLEEFISLAQSANEQGITLSTIALGVEADQELMFLIAEAGKGRFYPVLEAMDLPKILIDESRAARGENVHEGETSLVQGEDAHPILSGFRVGQLPALQGYNALESKADQGAEDVLLSADFQDPVLSVWQYGLGRVAAWTSDMGEEWAGNWADWEEAGRFWSQVIRYTLPDPAQGPGEVEVEAGLDSVQIRAQLLSPTGIPLNGLQVVFSLASENGQIRAYPLIQTGPGLYELKLPLPPVGAYRGVVSYRPPGSTTRTEIAAPLVINYPAEWRPESIPSIEAWAADVGGKIVTWEDLETGDPPQAAASRTPDQALQQLLIALVILWPVEIAIRRRWMPWR
jgi:uncharacterized membrane protein